MIRATELNINLYEEAEADTEANWQAFLTVIFAHLAIPHWHRYSRALQDGRSMICAKPVDDSGWLNHPVVCLVALCRLHRSEVP